MDIYALLCCIAIDYNSIHVVDLVVQKPVRENVPRRRAALRDGKYLPHRSDKFHQH
jgi:hypothetical protein